MDCRGRGCEPSSSGKLRDDVMARSSIQTLPFTDPTLILSLEICESSGFQSIGALPDARPKCASLCYAFKQWVYYFLALSQFDAS